MAKWGEGDPRWIVEERPDATNVNNWHWTEKNATQWSTTKLKELFLDLTIENDKIGKCKISEVTKCEGEATASNRKAKLIFFYEWELKFEWKGQVNGDDEEIKGKLEILNLSEENDANEIDIEVTTKCTTDAGYALKDMLRKQGLEIIRKKIGQYIDCIHKEFSVGMILPKKGDEKVNLTKKSDVKQAAKLPETNNSILSQVKKKDIQGLKMETVKYTCKQNFKCRVNELYNTFTVKEMVQAFTRGGTLVEAEKGGNFEILNGSVTGKFIDLVPNKKIVMNWRIRSWPAGHHSQVQLEFEDRDDSTDLILTQTGIPKQELESTKGGWSRYYWDSIRVTFGFGALLT